MLISEILNRSMIFELIGFSQLNFYFVERHRKYLIFIMKLQLLHYSHTQGRAT